MTELREEQKHTTIKPETRREKAYVALILAVFVVTAGIVFLYPRTHGESPTDAAPKNTAADAPSEPRIITREVEKIIEVEKEITVETLQQGLNDLGFLITEEYYFTDLVSYSSIKKFLNTDISLPFTESSYMVSYDGVVSAGVDLSAAAVEKDDEHKRITVHLPGAVIRSVDIDLDSFQLRAEKAGFGNPLSVRDFNNSLQELEKKARQNAVDRGLLEKADENAGLVASRWIASLADLSVYSLEFVSE